jgi:hypothetical protein
MRSETFPCLICGGRLLRDMEEYEAQPQDGVMCSTSGNYGSTVFDPMNGESILFNICDKCLVRAGEQGRLMITQNSIPVRTDSPTSRGHSMLTRVGCKYVERAIVPWHRGLRESDESETLEIDEILAHYDDKRYRWNLDRAGFEWMKRELERDE